MLGLGGLRMIAGVRTWVSWLLILSFSTNEVPRGLLQCRTVHYCGKVLPWASMVGLDIVDFPQVAGWAVRGRQGVFINWVFCEACVVVPWLGECLGRGTTQAAWPHPVTTGEKWLALKFSDGSIWAILGLA